MVESSRCCKRARPKTGARDVYALPTHVVHRGPNHLHTCAQMKVLLERTTQIRNRVELIFGSSSVQLDKPTASLSSITRPWWDEDTLPLDEEGGLEAVLPMEQHLLFAGMEDYSVHFSGVEAVAFSPDSRPAEFAHSPVELQPDHAADTMEAEMDSTPIDPPPFPPLDGPDVEPVADSFDDADDGMASKSFFPEYFAPEADAPPTRSPNPPPPEDPDVGGDSLFLPAALHSGPSSPAAQHLPVEMDGLDVDEPASVSHAIAPFVTAPAQSTAARKDDELPRPKAARCMKPMRFDRVIECTMPPRGNTMPELVTFGLFEPRPAMHFSPGGDPAPSHPCMHRALSPPPPPLSRA